MHLDDGEVATWQKIEKHLVCITFVKEAVGKVERQVIHIIVKDVINTDLVQE